MQLNRNHISYEWYDQITHLMELHSNRFCLIEFCWPVIIDVEMLISNGLGHLRHHYAILFGTDGCNPFNKTLVNNSQLNCSFHASNKFPSVSFAFDWERLRISLKVRIVFFYSNSNWKSLVIQIMLVPHSSEYLMRRNETLCANQLIKAIAKSSSDWDGSEVFLKQFIN